MDLRDIHSTPNCTVHPTAIALISHLFRFRSNISIYMRDDHDRAIARPHYIMHSGIRIQISYKYEYSSGMMRSSARQRHFRDIGGCTNDFIWGFVGGK